MLRITQACLECCLDLLALWLSLTLELAEYIVLEHLVKF